MSPRLPLLAVVLATVSALTVTAAPPTEINLDVHVFRDATPQSSLEPGDVAVVEDGVAQVVQKVSPASGPRTIVVFVDAWHMAFEGARDVRAPIGRLLDRVLGDGDRVALHVAGAIDAGRITFESKAEVLARLGQDSTWEHVRAGWRDPKEDRLAQCYPAAQFGDLATDLQVRYREAAVLDDLSSVVAQLSQQATARTAVMIFGDGWRVVGPRVATTGTARGPFSGRGRFGGFGGRGGFGGERPATEGPRTDCDEDRVALSSLNDSIRLDRLADAANRAMVSFYPFYARAIMAATRPGAPLPRLVEPAVGDEASRLDALRQIAGTTDGVAATDPTSVDRVAERLAADLAIYHVVTYTSTNPKLDNRFRSVTVRSVQPGVRIRARRGYRGASVEEVLDAARAGATSPVVPGTAVSAPPASSAGFVLRAVNGYRKDRTSQLWIVGELDYRTRRQVAWTAGGRAQVTVVGADGRTVFEREVDLPASSSSFVVTAPADAGVEPGEYAVRVRLQANNADDVSVATNTRVSVGVPGEVGEALLWRRGPSTGPRFVLTASFRFLRSERIRLEVPRLGDAMPTAVMLDRLGQPNTVPVSVSERPDDSGEFSWIVAEAPLAALAQGQYAIEIAVGTSKHRTPFEVVPY